MANNTQPSSAQPGWLPAAGSMGPQSFTSPVSAQFRPLVSAQQGHPYAPAPSQQFRPVGQVSASNVGITAVQNQQPHFSQPMPPFPPRPSQPGVVMPSSQPIAVSYSQMNRALISGSTQSQPTGPSSNTHMHGFGAPGMHVSSPYAFAPSSFAQSQNNVNIASQFQHMTQGLAPVGGQPWPSSANQSAPLATAVQHSGQQFPGTSSIDSYQAAGAYSINQQSASDWQEHTSADGRRYYYNKKTRQSSWEKPLELMTPIEERLDLDPPLEKLKQLTFRVDASTVWKEFTTPEGRKYYYNKITKQSKWTIPEDLKLAREQAQVASSQETLSEGASSQFPAVAAVVSSAETPTAAPASFNTPPLTSPVTVTPVPDPSPTLVSGSTDVPVMSPPVPSPAGAVTSSVTSTPVPTFSGSPNVPASSVNANATMMTSFGSSASQDTVSSLDGTSAHDIKEAKKGMATAGKVNVTTVEEKAPDDEPLVYTNKQEAKSAFKALLESANVQSDWTWEQTMREIINDKRYGALKTLGERKQAFNEYLGQRKKLEAEEKRMRQKKAREEFTKMLEESQELTSSMRWSKAQSLFENDERFKAVERVRDREDLFESYIVELERKEKERAADERRRNLAEYKKFLESCDFIKVTSQWRKVQDRLEDDEICSCLEKIDRLLVFQDYIQELEKEEEEKRKIQKEQLRRAERKNRDAFRKLMEEHVADGTLTAKTYWRDYCLEVKDLPQYHAVASNTSGSTPKDLFEDVFEELEKQYHEDKTRVKDAMKSGKITVVPTWTFEDFKSANSEDLGSVAVSDINLNLVYEELVERAKEKEEKEARKRQRLADDFTELLESYKEITASSKWEDCKAIFEDSQEYRSISDENFAIEIFEEYVAHLQEKAKEKERKHEEEKARKVKEREKEREEKEKRKDKERKEKDRERETEKGKERTRKDETETEDLDLPESYGHKEDKKRDKEKDRKHRKRHQSAIDDESSDRDDKEEPKRSRRHGSDRKKSRKHAHSPESDGEGRHKKHKKDHRDGSRRSGGHDELEDGELGEDGEIQ